ncbi:hypothetical protein [Nocardia noduli]|uniref:hypothetical protein n=1 Tax=Nocardia noduli TaxID=2815722 RepID=UPI001C211B7F|nr:hypothetical protein [Nocardia noduli]
MNTSPAAVEAFEDLTAPDTLELLAKAPDPVTAARLSRTQIRAALTRARRRDVDTKATRIHAALRTDYLRRDQVIDAASAATTRASIQILNTLREQIAELAAQVEAHLGRHPDAEIILSQHGIDRPRARGMEHRAALRQLANRLVGILHGCLKPRTPYDEATAWSPDAVDRAAAA